MTRPESILAVAKEKNMNEDKQQAEREAFQKDAEQCGFDMERFDCAAHEPWGEYVSAITGHRWGGWLAGVEYARSHLSGAQKKEGDYPDERMRRALTIIANWTLPATGKFWDDDRTRPVSYEAEYGSNGARSYMQTLAISTLATIPPPAAAEAPAVDVGGLEYKGNSVSHWHAKAKAYGDTVLKVCQMLADAGYLDPSKRENHIEDMLRAALASQPKADRTEPFIDGDCIASVCASRGADSTEAKQAADAFVSAPEWKKLDSTEAPEVSDLDIIALIDKHKAASGFWVYTASEQDRVLKVCREILALRPKEQPTDGERYWHQLADERSAEIIRLNELLATKAQPLTLTEEMIDRACEVDARAVALERMRQRYPGVEGIGAPAGEVFRVQWEAAHGIASSTKEGGK